MSRMEKVSENEIGRIVDEVVRRVAARMQGSPAAQAASPAAASATCGPECKCPTCKDQRTQAGKEMLEKGACRIGCADPGSLNCGDLAKFIDHTLLKANATEKEIDKLCEEARMYKFASVCVNTSHVDQCARLLAGTEVKVCCVVGFPLGAMSSDAKAFETRDAILHGAQEIDMVINVGKLVSGNYAGVFEDVRAVVRAASGHTVKVILETAMLNEEQKIAGCVLAKAAGADFVKTSTGFGPGGATAQDIALMRRIVGPDLGVKASGGIRDCATAQEMIRSGATRIGASASIGIVKG